LIFNLLNQESSKKTLCVSAEKWLNTSGWSSVSTSFYLQHFLVCILASCPSNACVWVCVCARSDEPVKERIRIHCTILHPSHDCCAFCCN